jgi:hypothetical protein
MEKTAADKSVSLLQKDKAINASPRQRQTRMRTRRTETAVEGKKGGRHE